MKTGKQIFDKAKYYDEPRQLYLSDLPPGYFVRDGEVWSKGGLFSDGEFKVNSIKAL